MMAIRVLGTSGGYGSWIMKGIEYALSKGAIVSNHSYGGGRVYSSEKQYYSNLANNNPNHVFVYAAGNANSKVSSTYPRFGCALEMPNQICVASSTKNDERSYFSNYGKDMVHVFAPGSDIVSTTPNGKYSSYSGTSMASPQVAGLAALIRSMRSMTGVETKNWILGHVQVKAKYADFVSTSGLIDVYGTLNALGKCDVLHKTIFTCNGGGFSHFLSVVLQLHQAHVTAPKLQPDLVVVTKRS